MMTIPAKMFVFIRFFNWLLIVQDASGQIFVENNGELGVYK